ncbi:hypothetical protein BDA99DRAFT_576219 [Phascolomyces articulosus]|uniref:B-block binding subunit of TFIIIC domain-containing protein n=1 Tax=Phascolomyces articulosus TaxID=60185 RepID=A0AAD5PA13_9FUNG|nr:hypothetical protein BDA99DRAFT_576219 [Phascolomyces articulosus]
MEATAIEELIFYGAQGCEFNTLWSSIKKSKRDSRERLLKALSKNKSIELYHTDQQLDNVRLIASLSLRKKNLTREIKNPEANISDNVFQVLEGIAQKRHEGITQVKLSKELGMKSATTYTRVKRLESLGLIVRHPAVQEKTYTQMCYHVRFAPKDDLNMIITKNGTIQHEMVDRKMVQVLTEAKDHMLPLTELFTALGMTTEKHIAWIRNHIAKRVEQGIFEKIKVVSDNKRVVYLKWIAPLASIKKIEKSDNAKKDLERENASLCGEALAKVILQQVERNPGVTTKDLYDLIPDVKWSNLRKMLYFNVQKDSKFRLYTIIESQGRIRQYRYFTHDGIMAYHQNRSESTKMSDDDEQHSTNIAGKKRKRGNTNELISTQSHPISPQINNGSFLTETSDSSNENTTKRREEQEKADCNAKTLRTNGGTTTKIQAQPMKGSNITSNKRKQAITTIILRDKIREINNDLREEVGTMAGNLDDTPPIARTTLIRLAESLHANNIIRVVRTTIPIYGGGVENKILLLHPDLRQDDSQVQQYLNCIRTNKIVNPYLFKRKPVQEIHVSSDATERSDLSQKQLVSRNIMHLAPEKHWREVALRHGWIRSKWLRAKLLHEYLFAQHKDTIQLGKLLDELPLHIYCQIIGLYRYSEKVEEFMRTAKKDMALSCLPKEIENEMITSRYRLRSQLSVLVDILEALELLKRVSTMPSLSINDSTVQLLDVGKIKNFSIESWPVIRTFSLSTLQDIQDFWTELQFVCTSSDSAGNIKPGHILDTILMPHTWVTVPMLTNEQRNVLDQHLDRSQGTAPVDDTPLIVYLSRTLGLPQERIKNYFNGFLRAYNKQKKKKIIKSSQRAMVSKLIQSGQTFDHAPLGFKLLAKEERTFAPTRKFIRNRYPRPTISTPKQPFNRWPEVDHEALLHAYVIMRYRTETNGTLFSWAPISQVITNRDQSACRRRISHLKETWPQFNDRTEILKRKWAIIYAQGIATGELIDNRPWDWRDYDLIGQLEYFIKNLQHVPEESTISIPSNATLLKTQYDVTTSPLIKTIRRPATLELRRDYRVPHYEGLSNTILLASIVLRMVLMMPQDTYDAEKSRVLFRPFTENTIEKALQYLRSTGALVFMRKNFNRLIPGQVYNVSEKFIRTFSSERFPRQMLDQANEFYRELSDGNDVSISQTPGAMAVFLDMISTDELSLEMTSAAQFLNTHRNFYYPRLKHDAVTNDIIDRNLAFSIALPIQTNTQNGTMSAVYDCNIMIPNNKAIDFQRLQLSTRIQHIYSILENFGVSGATLMMLKEHFPNLSNKDINESIDELKSKNLVCQVGFIDQRLVVSYQAPAWLVEFKPGHYLKPRMWCTIDGSVNQDVFQGCMRKLVLLITEKPGISLPRIHEVFQGYMTAAEVNDLLHYLVQNNVIKGEYFTNERNAKGFHGLFKPTQLLKRTKSNNISKNMVVHYWLRDGYHYWRIK